MDNEETPIESMTDRELIEDIALNMRAARTVAEQLMEQFNGISKNPKFAVFAKMLGIGQ